MTGRWEVRCRCGRKGDGMRWGGKRVLGNGYKRVFGSRNIQYSLIESYANTFLNSHKSAHKAQKVLNLLKKHS